MFLPLFSHTIFPSSDFVNFSSPLRFFAYGLTGVIVDWTMAGMKEDEEELSKTLQSMVINTERIGYEFYMQRKKEKEGIK